MKQGNKLGPDKAVDYLVANLLDFFRKPSHENKFFEAAHIAVAHVSKISSDKEAQILSKRYLFFSSKLKNNLSSVSIRSFASDCLESAIKIGLLEDKSIEISTQALHKKAKLELSQSLASGHSEASAIHRAANVLLKAKRARDAKEKIKNLAMRHPLKEVLEISTMNDRPLAKEDIKNHLLKLKTPSSEYQGVLYRLLERTQAFSTYRLHALLGDELFFLCRPLGFLDEPATILVVEVPTSAHLYALTYRKMEIIRLMKRDLTFRNVKMLRFKVASS
jgi:hypothetical protein